MELHQLQYFVAVVETGSFSRAADRCNITQPSLSQQIIKLESELGHRLFDRLGRTIAITEFGEILYSHALAILSEVEQAKHAATTGYSPETLNLSVGIIPTLAPFVIYQAIERFNEMYPEAALTIQEDTTEELIDGLMNATLDIAYVSLPLHHKNIMFDELFVEKLFVAMRSNHPQAEVPKVAINELEGLPFIRLTDKNCLADQLDSFCFTQKIDPTIVYQTSNLATTMDIVRSGIGVSLVPECSMATAGDHIEFREIENSKVQRTIVAARHKRRQQSILATSFSQIIQETWETITQK